MRQVSPWRPSRVLQMVRAGGFAVCAKSNLVDPRVVDMIGRAGFDCFWACQEHVPNSINVIEAQILAAKAHDMDTVARVRRGSYSDLITPLEADAAGIMVPHVMNADDARQIVQHCRFHPLGRRPVDGGNADGGFGGLTTAQYMHHANDDRFLMLQIEDPEALDQVEQIAQIEGFDFLMFGPADFAHGLGIPGQMDDPRIDEARQRVAAACKQYGKFAATTGLPSDLPRYRDMGYQFVNVCADVAKLWQHFTEQADLCRKALGDGVG